MMLEIIGWICAIWMVYQLVEGYLLVRRIKRDVNEAVEIMQEQATYKMLVFERIEQNGHSVILCYDNDNNFIAQGSTREEVIEQAKQRYPKQNLATYKTEELQWINNKSDAISKDGSSNS